MDSSTDSSMDEMALFHQMFNNNYLSVTAAENNVQNTPSYPTTIMNDNNRNTTDLSSHNPTISLHTNSAIQEPQSLKTETGLSTMPSTVTNVIPPPQSPLPPTSTSIQPPSSSAVAPKRSTNGKIIRYSKNKQLAHGALRMYRQRSSSGSSLTTEAILHALHIANKQEDDKDVNMVTSTGTPPISMSTSLPTYSNANAATPTEPVHTSRRRQSTSSSKSISSPPTTTTTPANNNQLSYSFKNLDDVTKFLEELPPIVEGSPFLSPSHHGRKSGIIKAKGHSNSGDRFGKPKSADSGDGPNKRQQKAAISSNSNNNKNSNDHETTTTTVMEITNNNGVDGTQTTSSRPMYVLASTLLSKHTRGH
ncbi:hypothetical protein BCR42DRAFT_419194 [Absidia repens]|uniref:Uncharacterized protein n=1 Tax=Absidia repens TaxID=90262 RepID=A0A1X2IAZ3_9FUNG|nr:hypothetical protein BCR42DRAFT_419194 [Absidia repens]